MKMMDTRAYVGMLKELVEQGREVRMVISGSSMAPFLIHGRDSIFFRAPERELRKGDIVFYERPGGQFVVHRICRVHADGYDIIGDAQTEIEHHVQRKQIFAWVTKVEFHFCHPCKDLLPLHMMLDFRLCIPDYVITVCMNAADPMHDKLSARPLVKYDITFPKFPLRRSEENTVASMNQKRRHAAPGNHHTHFSALLYKFFQHSDIGTCIHHFHACFSLF